MKQMLQLGTGGAEDLDVVEQRDQTAMLVVQEKIDADGAALLRLKAEKLDAVFAALRGVNDVVFLGVQDFFVLGHVSGLTTDQKKKNILLFGIVKTGKGLGVLPILRERIEKGHVIIGFTQFCNVNAMQEITPFCYYTTKQIKFARGKTIVSKNDVFWIVFSIDIPYGKG